MKKYLVTNKCNKCNKFFASEDDVKYCPYCGNNDISIVVDKTTKMTDVVSQEFLNYPMLRGNSRYSYRELMTEIILLLDKYTSHTTSIYYKTRKLNLIRYIDLVEGHLHNIASYNKKINYVDFIDYPFGDNYYIELRLVNKNQTTIIGSSYGEPISNEIIQDLMYRYGKNGWNYFYLHESKITDLIYNISKYANLLSNSKNDDKKIKEFVKRFSKRIRNKKSK